jgi:hypothetical protein
MSAWACWQEAERAYLLWKARQVADQQGSGAVAVVEGGQEGKALLDSVLFASLLPDASGREHINEAELRGQHNGVESSKCPVVRCKEASVSPSRSVE